MLQRVSFPVASTDVEGILHIPDGETVGGVITMGGGAIEGGEYVCRALEAAGIAALRFAFRVQRNTPEQLKDAAAAIRLLRAHPQIPQKVGAVGHSQGGMVAAVVAGRDSRLRAAALISAPAETTYVGALRPVAEITRTRARVIVLHGGADEIIDAGDADRYASVLSQARVTHRRVIIDGADHIFSRPADRERMLTELTSWLRESFA